MVKQLKAKEFTEISGSFTITKIFQDLLLSQTMTTKNILMEFMPLK